MRIFSKVDHTAEKTTVDPDLLNAKMRQTDVLSHPRLKRNTYSSSSLLRSTTTVDEQKQHYS